MLCSFFKCLEVTVVFVYMVAGVVWRGLAVWVAPPHQQQRPLARSLGHKWWRNTSPAWADPSTRRSNPKHTRSSTMNYLPANKEVGTLLASLKNKFHIKKGEKKISLKIWLKYFIVSLRQMLEGSIISCKRCLTYEVIPSRCPCPARDR